MVKEQLEIAFNPETKEGQKFLQDVPGWEIKLKKYELNQKYATEMELWGGSRRYEDAEGNVNYLNHEYGVGSASLGMRFGMMQTVNIIKPLKEEFIDILDTEENLLPKRPETKTVEMDNSQSGKKEAA